ncbi:MAG: hypothetical protein RLZZ575_921 [Actinomycetota bacterium]|jgi:hypothetical protein
MADIKVRVGQQNSLKVVSAISGIADKTILSQNVIGGIASVSQLNVSGVSTFVGVSTFKDDVYIDGSLNISGILTVNQSIYYPPGNPYGIAYFDPSDQLVSTGSTSSSISESNYILSTNNSGIPTWTNTIDGGFY